MVPFLRQIRARRVLSAAFLLLFAAISCAAQSIAPVVEVSNPPNAAAQQAKPYVVLVSLDGFRYDYSEKYGAKNLLALAKRGASAPEGMIPSFPSVTFPNHYTIVTGLYPEHHGIVANTFYDPARKERYSYTDPKSSSDGSWYGGTPLWVLAEQQGMRSACFFWPASEAEIQGKRPSFYLHYDDKFPGDKRVEQVLAWLKLPAEKRPHFIALYYSDVDHAGHQFGPESAQVADAVHHVDELMGTLVAGLDALHLRVDLFVVSDHGMERVRGGWITLASYLDLSHFETAGSLLYAASEADAQKAYQALAGASEDFHVYRRTSLPPHLHYDANPRAGDPVVVPDGPYLIRASGPRPSADEPGPPAGMHGYDPEMMPSMKAIFFAAGPDIRDGEILPPFENIHIYPLIAKILGLQIGRVDGKLDVLQDMIKKPSGP